MVEHGKTIAKNLINKNKNLLIIDVSNGLSYKNGVKELWMSPNNYLMLAKNIKDYFLTQEDFTVARCEHCGFLFLNPRPDKAAIAPYYKSDIR